MNDISNPWNSIALEDYERHMEHELVAQSQMLNELTRKYLKQYEPESALFLGISGGNGLEHIDTQITQKVYAIDINESYLEATRRRFAGMIRQLELIHADISTSNVIHIQADFIWAALIFEYIDIQRGLEFIRNSSSDSAAVVVTVQANNGRQSVSPTGIESVKTVREIFNIVDQQQLINCASNAGFHLISSEENMLPFGKSLITFTLTRKTTDKLK